MKFWIFMLIMDLLLPFTMIGFGRYFMKKAPKEINSVFGYRTSMSMKNKDTWEFAHKYCGKVWYVCGMVMLPITVIFMLLVIGKNEDCVSKWESAGAVPDLQRILQMYLFDEPEAALSPQRQLTLLMQIYSCAKEGAQFIIVTHSPILLGIPDADIYCFDDGRIHLCEYEETESYRVTEMFINNRQMLLDKLLTD